MLTEQEEQRLKELVSKPWCWLTGYEMQEIRDLECKRDGLPDEERIAF
ncbi:hypothetical protein phiV141_12 [Vibrio phage phiV141]|uniref:Uncharacterized protein n=1 Tax=Vibrio phage phiV141 TaxID=2723905 RepID=A0A7D7ITD1_9CAUD|nr:hypothetical protein phiV141_12 [Vibrio phage phiV141]